MPEGFPSIVLALAYGFTAKAIVDKTQFTTEDIEATQNYSRYSNWSVAGVSVIAFILFLIVGVAVLMILDALGIVSILD